MASIVNYDGGLKRIEFMPMPGGRPKMIRLGRVNVDVARGWLSKIEAILADRLANRPHTPEVAKWLGGLDEKMLARLRAVGLADGVGLTAVTLGELLDRFFATLTVKQSTRVAYNHIRNNLLAYFGGKTPVSDVTAADADAWRAWLVEHERLAPATTARRVVAARTIWRKAVRWNLTRSNPFEGAKTGTQTNAERQHFITTEVIDRLLNAAPNAEWRAIIALARYGGMRCPSEHFALRWADIDWDEGRIVVHAPKTAHHDGGGVRIAPLYPELRPHLLALFEQAPEGAEYVFAKRRKQSANLRAQFERIIKRAGLKPWPRLFQNLRASRESELMRNYDLATVCKWIGNTPAVAAKHYAMSTDISADFQRAVGLDKGAVKSAERTPEKAQRIAQTTARRHNGQELTNIENQSEITGDNALADVSGHLLTTTEQIPNWARQDSNL